jgi:hypothetical protein
MSAVASEGEKALCQARQLANGDRSKQECGATSKHSLNHYRILFANSDSIVVYCNVEQELPAISGAAHTPASFKASCH